MPFALWQVTSLQAKKAVFKTYNQAQLRLCFFLCQAARVLLTYFVYAPLRMLVFRDFQRLLCARLSLCFKHAPLLVLVFLGFCRLLFGKSPLCKQKSSVQDVQPSTAFLPCFFFVRLWARCSPTFVRSAPCPRLPRLVRLAPRLVNVWQEITTPLRMLVFRDFQRLLCA